MTVVVMVAIWKMYHLMASVLNQPVRKPGLQMRVLEPRLQILQAVPQTLEADL